MGNGCSRAVAQGNFYEVVKNKKPLISYDAALLSIDTKEKMDRLRLH